MTFVIDGLTAVGKTSFCNNLYNTLIKTGIPCKVFEENFDHDLLQKYIKEPKTYSEEWTKDITRRKLKTYDDAMKFNGVAIIDRGYQGDLAISSMRVSNGELDRSVYQWQIEQFESKPLNMSSTKIFLDCEPDVALERCRKRNRPGEEVYDLTFFSKLRYHYKKQIMNDDWIILETWTI